MLFLSTKMMNGGYQCKFLLRTGTFLTVIYCGVYILYFNHYSVNLHFIIYAKTHDEALQDASKQEKLNGDRVTATLIPLCLKNATDVFNIECS